MTLQQLQYVIAIVEHGSISETAKQLYVAQPTLSSAVRTLEEEFGILIFHRSARGIALTEDGREFLSYARQVVEQADLLHQHYGATRQTRQRCSISTQHYAFAVDAFVQLIQRLSPESYESRCGKPAPMKLWKMSAISTARSESSTSAASTKRCFVPCWRNIIWNSTRW